MIIEADESHLQAAAEIHSDSWMKSHVSFCTEQFLNLHTPEHQLEYLKGEIRDGKRLYMLIKDKPVGIVTVKGGLIENLYVLTSEQHKGYGTELLMFALEKCTEEPTMWILDNNKAAYSLYVKYGFHLSGAFNRLTDTLNEVELVLFPDGTPENDEATGLLKFKNY